MHLRSKTVQQLLSVILSVVMVLSMLPMEVLAQETPPVTTPMDLTAATEDLSGDGWSWTQSTKTLTLTGLTLTVSDDSAHALTLPDGATIDLTAGTTSTLTGGSKSTVYSSGEVKLRGEGSLTVYGRGWRSATLDMFIPGTLAVEYDTPGGGAVLKTDEGTEGAAICANVTLDNGVIRATGPDFASADDGTSVGLRGRLTTHGSSVEAQLTARTGYASYGLYFDKQGSGRGDTWTMGLGKVTATAGHALSRYSYGLYVDYSSVYALELDGTQLTATGGESDQYGSQGVFAGEEVIVKNGATVTATGGQVNSSYESVGFNAVSWLTVSGENSKVLGYGGTSVKGGSKGVRCDSRFTLTDGYVFGQGGVSYTSSRNVGVEFKRLIMESGKLEGISGSPDSSYQTWGGQFNAYGLYCTGSAKITGGELIGTANGTDRDLNYSAYGFYGSDELTMSGGTLRATTGDTPNAGSGTLAALSVTSNKCKVQLSGGTIYAKAGVSNDDRSYGMWILGTGSTLTMTNTEDAAQPLNLYVTGQNMALYATALADGDLLPEITASPSYNAEADTLTDGYTFSNKQYWKDGTAPLTLAAAACLHDVSDDTGLCGKCGKQVYEAVLLTGDTVTQRYAAASEAFAAAQTEENQGCTLRLLVDLIDDGEPLVHDPVVTITGGRFTLDLHGHTIAGKTSDYKEGVVTVTGGQLRIENGTLENLYTGNDSKAQALILLGTDTHVTLANVTAIGATPPNGDTSASVYVPDGARLTIESGEFTGRVAGYYTSAPTETPFLFIAGGTFHSGLSYSIHETEANTATLLAILKESYALARTDGTLVDLGTEPSFSRFSGTYTLSGEVQVVAHTHDVRSGRPGYCACGYACPHDGQTADSYFTLPVCSLCGTTYGTLPQDTIAPTGKIVVNENNWWQSFLNTVTFGLFFPSGARFTIEAADDSTSHTGYDPDLHPITVKYLLTDQHYTLAQMPDMADQFLTYPGKAVPLVDDQSCIIYAQLTDWAGNVTYLSSDGLTVDATAPELSSDMVEGRIYCENGLRIAFRDDHLKSVTLNGTEMPYTAEGGWYVLWLSAASGSAEGQQTLTVTDEAGNSTTLHFQWYAGHDFDDTGLCGHCGIQAEARWNDTFYPYLEDALNAADTAEDGTRFLPVVMVSDAALPADAGNDSFSLSGMSVVLALEGHTLTLSAPMVLEQSSGSLTIRDSTRTGKITGQPLTVKGGRLTVETGHFENTLDLQAYNVSLYGGTFARITSEDAAYPRAALASSTAYQQEDGQLILRSDITATLENVTVVPCPHDDIDGITCRICGTEMAAKVTKDDTLRYFAGFEDAARYAGTLEDSAITLLRDSLWNSTALPTGTYTLDLNGKTLSGSNDLMIDASLTVCDSQGGGKLWRSGVIQVLGGHVAITGGNFNRVYLASDSAGLTVSGGTFARIAYSGDSTSATPLSFPADGYTFQKADGTYANTDDVTTEENLRYLEDVTAATVPFTITRSPVDTDLYTTTPIGYRPDFVTEVTFHVSESRPTIEFQWYQVGDPDRIKSYGSAVAWQNPFTMYNFIDGPAQYYAIFSYKGYSVRTDVLTVRELVCDHPGVDAGNRCSQCHAEVAASVELNGSIGYYLSLSDALTLARTDAYRGCTVTALRSSTDTISVNSGTFTLTAAQDVTLGGKVTLAKKANVTLSGGSYTNSASIFGPNRIAGGTFYGAVALRDGSSVSGGSFVGAVTLSGTVTVTGGTFTGDVTINNGGKLAASAGTFGNVNVKTGGGGALTGGHFGKITQLDGSPCAALLSEGYAYSENGIINGYVPIVGGVDVVPHAQHQYVWLNQKLLCGCGHVADEDADAPVITGITNGETYYGDVTFTVTDAHDFTVTVDGQPAAAENGLYTLPADNASHEIVAEDVAGNRTVITVSVYRIYTVTPPTGTGFTFTGETTVRHGQDYRFRVDIAPGYSKLPDYALLVNGQVPNGMGDADFDECLIPSVEGDLTITVTGVADITPPEAELTIAGNPFRRFLNTVTFGLFFKSTQTVTVTASDLGSGVDTAAWMLSDTVFASQDAITGSWTDLPLTDGSGSFSIQPGQKGYVYLRVTDRAGNITVLNSDGVVVYTDAQSDTQQITYTKRSGQDVSFHVTLNGNTVTGVQLADGTPLTGFTAAEDGTVTLPAATLQALAAGEYTLYVTYAPLGVAYNDRYEASEAPAMTSVALSVQKAEGSVVILDDVSRDYNGQPVETPTVTSLGTGALTVEYRAQGGEFTTQAPKDAGSYTVRVTAAADDDYASASAQRDFRITAKSVTIDGVTVEPSKTYDGTADAAIVTGGTLSANFDGSDLRIVTGTAAYDNKNVGTGKTVSFSGFSLEGDAAGNYTLATQPADTTADITAKSVTIENVTVESSKTYDGTTDAAIVTGGTLSANFDGDDLRIVTGTAAYDTKNVGTGKTVSFSGFSLEGDAAGNYTLATQPADTTADITAKSVTIDGVTVEPSKTYDGTTDASIVTGGTLSTNFDGDDLRIVTGTAAYDNKNVGTDKTVSFSGFSLEGDAAGNYTLAAQPADTTADITAKSVTIENVTVEPSKTYDGTTDASIVTGGTLSANFDGDDLRIVTGTAAYDSKNVGTGKTVSFSGFSLEGNAAGNYTLAAQPANTTADITARTATVEDLHIQDKLYDGTDRAEYDGEPTLGNAVPGDDVALVKGTPSFTSIRAAEDIAIRFTDFSLTGADAGNYALTQPTGITASILPYALTGGEYAVNSNDWINHDFVVTAAEGYLLSLTDTADGVWQQTLRATDETAEGRLTFYVKDLSTGAISLQVTEQYRIDRTQPTGEIRVDERTAWQSFLSKLTFGLFYREEQAVTITSADEASGVAATEYLLSAEDLDIPALEQETFLPYEKALALVPDGEYVVYARITDRAGNDTYLRSDGMVLDATAPAITGAENGGVYCAAVTLTITDAYPVTVSVNGTPVELTEGRLVLQPAEGTQLVTAADPAGNKSRLEITVNDGHTWGDWSSNGDGTHTRTCTIPGCGALETEDCTGGEATCVDRAVCEVCGGAYGDVDAHRHADLRHVEAKAATTEAPGNIEYWYCAACGKYFADAQASRELQQADTVAEQLPATPTGDEAPLTLWVIVLAACAGLTLLLLVLRRRNSHRTA